MFDPKELPDKDYKILATPCSHVRQYKGLSDIDPSFLKISQNFFSHYKDLNGKRVEVFDWHEAKLAHDIINNSVKNS